MILYLSWSEKEPQKSKKVSSFFAYLLFAVFLSCFLEIEILPSNGHNWKWTVWAQVFSKHAKSRL